MQSLVTVEQLQDFRKDCWQAGKTLAFVPTMGALHAGHMELVKEAKKHCDLVLVSIFVNPLQFGPNEDFSRYPRTLKADAELLATNGVQALFAPNISEMYGPNFQTTVTNDHRSDILCGAFRPGHFKGVLTVVLKLLNLVQPDALIMGKKDYQQLYLIRRMVEDLSVPVQVVGVPTMRESDGLAMSSRNRYLDAARREQATGIYSGLVAAKQLWDGGVRDADKLTSAAMKSLEDSFEVEYVELRKQGTLQSFDSPVDENAVLLVAAKLGDVRLIDNWELDLT